MDRQDETGTTATSETNPESAQRIWITPSFESMELKDALSGSGGFNVADASTYYS